MNATATAASTATNVSTTTRLEHSDEHPQAPQQPPARWDAGDPCPTEASSPDGDQLPITNYDKLDAKQLRAQLSPLSQVELAAIESYELAHQARPAVLNRLNWLKGSEPVPGYDALATEEIVQALAGADTETVKAVREYERHHQDRQEVRAEVARALPTAPASAGEDRAREEQAGSSVKDSRVEKRRRPCVGQRPTTKRGRNGLPFGRPPTEGPEG